MNPDTEPILVNDPALSGVLAELEDREPIFHRPQHGTSRSAFETMTVADFWEVGASGRRYSRDWVLAELQRRQENPAPDVWEASGFLCRKLAPDVYLLTYTLVQNHVRWTRRSTIWQRTDEGWRIVFHQGTVVQDA